MSTDQVRLERRAAQRFAFHLPVSVRLAGTDREGYGFTQDLSAQGALFYTDFPLSQGNAVELTLVMPSSEASGSFGRISALHEHNHEEKTPPVFHSRSVPVP